MKMRDCPSSNSRETTRDGRKLRLYSSNRMPKRYVMVFQFIACIPTQCLGFGGCEIACAGSNLPTPGVQGLLSRAIRLIRGNRREPDVGQVFY